jgi:hypothetical protein
MAEVLLILFGDSFGLGGNSFIDFFVEFPVYVEIDFHFVMALEAFYALDLFVDIGDAMLDFFFAVYTK